MAQLFLILDFLKSRASPLIDVKNNYGTLHLSVMMEYDDDECLKSSITAHYKLLSVRQLQRMSDLRQCQIPAGLHCSQLRDCFTPAQPSQCN